MVYVILHVALFTRIIIIDHEIEVCKKNRYFIVSVYKNDILFFFFKRKIKVKAALAVNVVFFLLSKTYVYIRKSLSRGKRKILFKVKPHWNFNMVSNQYFIICVIFQHWIDVSYHFSIYKYSQTSLIRTVWVPKKFILNNETSILLKYTFVIHGDSSLYSIYPPFIWHLFSRYSKPLCGF